MVTMADPQDPRVAVYLDFDNIVMSWYDHVHGRNAYSRDRQRIAADPTEPEIAERLQQATVDVGAVIDYAASFGSITLTRAYADWSSDVNAEYRSQLVARAVDLVQLFPAAAYAKNGADIRLAVDAVEDMFRIPDITHVVIVGGDSDYVPLAQRCRRLGRYVVGVGVAGSTAKSLAAACDEFASYGTLPSVEDPVPAGTGRRSSGRRSGTGTTGAGPTGADGASGPGKDAADRTDGSDGSDGADGPGSDSSAGGSGAKGQRSGGRRSKGATQSVSSAPSDVPEDAADQDDEDTLEQSAEDDNVAATRLLARALRVSDQDDSEWLHSSALKTLMRRLDPSFREKALGFRSFTDFLKANEDVVELEESGHERMVRPREQEPAPKQTKAKGRHRNTGGGSSGNTAKTASSGSGSGGSGSGGSSKSTGGTTKTSTGSGSKSSAKGKKSS
jgi:uncharacterized LabA/DUF88 family protein